MQLSFKLNVEEAIINGTGFDLMEVLDSLSVTGKECHIQPCYNHIDLYAYTSKSDSNSGYEA